MDLSERRDVARKLLAGAGFRVGSLVLVRALAAARIVVFARLFTPADIGMATLAASCVIIAQSFANFGFYDNTIRNRDRSSAFGDTAFTLSLIFGLVVMAATLLGAPLLSRLFSGPLDAYVRVLAFLALTIPLNFPKALFEKRMRFGHPAAALVITEFLSLFIAVGAELVWHLGIWSLVAGQAAGVLLAAAYLWIVAVDRPRLGIHREHVRPILSFGTPFMLTSVNGQVMAHGDALIVVAYWGVSELAYYNFAWQLPILITSVASVVDTMLFPVYARLNERKEDLTRLFNMANKGWSIAGSFFGFGLLLFADQVVGLLYGPQWDPVVPILKVMTVSFIIRFCTGYAYDNLLLVRGRTAYMMKWSFVSTALILTVGLVMISRMGPIGGAWFWILQAAILGPLVRFPLIHQELGTLSFLRHVWQPVVAGLSAAGAAYLLLLYLPPWSDSVRLIAALTTYVAVYGGLFFPMDRQFMVDVRRFLALAGHGPGGSDV